MKLTAEQQAVVNHQAGHARVAAVAGAGKTTTMAARVLHLLASGVPPKRILVLMFNRSAKDDFQRRLAAMAPAGQALPDVRTFHSLGHRLTQSLCRWGALAPRKLLSADWQLERLLRQASINVLRDAVERRDAALEGDRLETLAHFCGLVKAEMITPEALYERLNFDPDTDYFPAAFAEAERLLEAEGVMTYADLLYRPLLALEADSALRGRVEGFLDHVIIDEYQDINAAQQRLLSVLVGTRAEVMAVAMPTSVFTSGAVPSPTPCWKISPPPLAKRPITHYQPPSGTVMRWRWLLTMPLPLTSGVLISYALQRLITRRPASQSGRGAVCYLMR